jgi:hypothetical protein
MSRGYLCRSHSKGTAPQTHTKTDTRLSIRFLFEVQGTIWCKIPRLAYTGQFWRWLLKCLKPGGFCPSRSHGYDFALHHGIALSS